MVSLLALDLDNLQSICTYLDPCDYCNLRLTCKTLSVLPNELILYQQALHGWRYYCSGMKFAIELNSDQLLLYTAKEESISDFAAEIFTQEHLSLIPTATTIYLSQQDNDLDCLSDLLHEDLVASLFIHGYLEVFKFIVNAPIDLDYGDMMIEIYERGDLKIMKDFVTTVGMEKLQRPIKDLIRNNYELLDLTAFVDITLYLVSLVDIDRSMVNIYNLNFLICYSGYDNGKLLQLIRGEYYSIENIYKFRFELILAQALDQSQNSELLWHIIPESDSTFENFVLENCVKYDLLFIYRELINHDLLNQTKQSVDLAIEAGAHKILDYLLTQGYMIDQEQERKMLNGFNGFKAEVLEVFHQHGYRFTVDVNITNVPHFMFLLYKHNYPMIFTANDLNQLSVQVLDVFLARGYHLSETYEVDCNRLNANEDGLDVLIKMAQLGVKIVFTCSADNLKQKIRTFEHARFVRNCNKHGALARIWGPR